MTSDDVLDLVIGALRAPGATSAGDLVYRTGDRPTQNDQYPNLRGRVVRETKQSLGRGGGPEFNVTATIRVIGEVSAPAAVGDAGAAQAEALLWQLKRQVEVAVVGSYPLERQIQQFASIDSQLAYNADGETHLAGIQIDFAIEFYQGLEDFALIASDDLDEVAATPAGSGLVGFTLQNLQQ